jgi:hypothetical protein
MRPHRLWLGVLIASCAVKPLPGDVQMGTYGLHAEPVAVTCGTDDAGSPILTDGGFDFDVTLTGQSDASIAWLTLAGCEPSASDCVRTATWTGQVLTSVADAGRSFAGCGACDTSLVETITLSLLSRSQADAVSLSCPADPLGSGTPQPDADAGITGPGNTGEGFDAILACGTLTTTLVATGQDGGACAAACLGCGSSYSLSGARK